MEAGMITRATLAAETTSERKNSPGLAVAPTRRQVITGSAVAFAGLALGSAAAQQQMAEAPSTGPDKTRTSLHQEVDFKASPHRIYEILLDSKLFTAFSKEPAEISPDVGGAFSMFGGRIVGRNVELVPDQRIVQAWRPAYWEPGVYTLVKFVLKEQGSQTRIVLDHTGFPEGDFESLSSGWKEHYWERLAKYLG
jgi:activator of HSP90 ATPase